MVRSHIGDCSVRSTAKCERDKNEAAPLSLTQAPFGSGSPASRPAVYLSSETTLAANPRMSKRLIATLARNCIVAALRHSNRSSFPRIEQLPGFSVAKKIEPERRRGGSDGLDRGWFLSNSPRFRGYFEPNVWVRAGAVPTGLVPSSPNLPSTAVPGFHVAPLPGLERGILSPPLYH